MRVFVGSSPGGGGLSFFVFCYFCVFLVLVLVFFWWEGKGEVWVDVGIGRIDFGVAFGLVEKGYGCWVWSW